MNRARQPIAFMMLVTAAFTLGAAPPPSKLTPEEAFGPGAAGATTEFTLEIAGKTVDIQLDKPATVDVNGKPVTVRLSERPETFKQAGVSFQYPPGLTIASDSDAEMRVDSWSLTGETCSLDFEHHRKSELPADELRKEIVQAISSEFEEGKRRASETSITLAGKRVRGTRIDGTNEEGKPVYREVYAWQAPNRADVYTIMLDDDAPPKKGERNPKAARLRTLLEKTFKYDAKPAK